MKDLDQPQDINNRIMKLQISLSCVLFVIVFSVYTCTLSGSEKNIQAFYEELRRSILSFSLNEKLFVLGDFKARAGRD